MRNFNKNKIMHNNDLSPLTFKKDAEQAGSYYRLVFKRKGKLSAFDASMNLVDNYPSGTNLISISDNNFKPSLGTLITMYNLSKNTIHFAYLSSSGIIKAVDAFTAGNYSFSSIYF